MGAEFCYPRRRNIPMNMPKIKRSYSGWGYLRAYDYLWNKAKDSARGRLSSWRNRLALLAMARKSPYHFPLKELWYHDCYIGWTSPKVQLLSRADRWLQLEICGFRLF